MRHTDAGLAIPDFPLAFGRLVLWRFAQGVNADQQSGRQRNLGSRQRRQARERLRTLFSEEG